MFNYRKISKNRSVGPCLTQPNQAFTVRQIIDQFARGELIPSVYSPTDDLDDSIDDDRMEEIIEFEDKIDAEGHLIQNQYSLFNETNESQLTAPAGDSKPSTDVNAENGSGD